MTGNKTTLSAGPEPSHGVNHFLSAGLVALFLYLCSWPVTTARAETVRVGCIDRQTFFQGLPQTPSGYGYEYLLEVGRYTGWDYAFISCPLDVCLKMLEEGELDLVGALRKSPDYVKRFAFPDHPQGVGSTVLLALESRRNVYFNDPKSFEGMRVGYYAQDPAGRIFEGYRARQNFNAQVVDFDNFEAMLEALKQGDVDAVVASDLLTVPGVKILAHVGAAPFFAVLSRSNPDLLRRFNHAVQSIHERDLYYTAGLHEKYLRRPLLLSQALSREEDAWLRENRPVRIAINPADLPVQGFGKSGGADGILVRLVRELFLSNGITPEFVPTKSYAESLRLMDNGAVDVVTGFGQSLRHRFGGRVQVSEPVLRAPVSLVGRAGSANTTPHTVGLGRGMALPQQLRESLGAMKLAHYENQEAALRALMADEVPLTLMTTWRFDTLARDPRYYSLRMVAMVPMDQELTLGVSSAMAATLLPMLNRAIAGMDFSRVQTVAYEYVLNRPREDFWPMVKEYSGMLLLLGAALLLLGAAWAIRRARTRMKHMVREAAFTDDVTGLGNLARFSQMGRAVPRDGSWVCGSMDINNFKIFNAYYGHAAGNSLLRQLGITLNGSLLPGEMVCRGSGDEFLLLLRWPGSMDALKHRLRKLETTLLQRESTLKGQRVRLGLSFGLYRMNDTAVTLGVAADRAATARKLSKGSYPPVYGEYDAAMHRNISEQRQIEQEMEEACERGEFFVRLQPKCNLETGDVVGAEALIRWQHPGRGEVSPGAYVHLFEKNGFILKLDMAVLDCVCRLQRRWADEGLSPLPISVNMSRLHALDADFATRIKDVIRSHGVDPRYIELELTETAFLENTARLLHIMDELSEFGVRFSMDDFGTGYSSLNMLREIPVDVLKLDRAFLMSVSDSRGRNIIMHVVQMAKDLDMDVVCEGVENSLQIDFLKVMQCDVGQGFYFSPPLLLEEFESFTFHRPVHALAPVITL